MFVIRVNKCGFESGNAFNQFYARFCVVHQDYFRDIEAEKNIGLSSIRSHARAPRGRFVFSVHCREWSAEICACVFLLRRHQSVVVAAYNIDFAAGASTEIAEENFVTATLQNRHANFAARRVEMTGFGRFLPRQEAVATGSKDRRWIGQGPNSWSSKDAVLFRNRCAG